MIPLQKESFKIPKGLWDFILLYELNIERTFQTIAPSEPVRPKLCDRPKAEIQPQSLVVPSEINPLNAELNPICYLLALLGAHHFLHVSGIRVKSLTLRLLISYMYIYGAPILDVSRSHTTTHHSR